MNEIVDQAVAYALAGGSSPRFAIAAHTDTVGADASNQALSQRRADAVRDVLIARGMPAEAITTAAYGETRLAVPTPDETAEPLNRRVEIDVSWGN
jgi:outer membrane protein OmpA-like peptidoglycan-associated protein